jgi:hypothetical protein
MKYHPMQPITTSARNAPVAGFAENNASSMANAVQGHLQRDAGAIRPDGVDHLERGTV